MREIQHELRPLAQKLRLRYPDVAVTKAEYSFTADGQHQQCIAYHASLPILVKHGLVTDGMVEDQSKSYRNTPIGDGHILLVCNDPVCKRSKCVELRLYTRAVPDERPRFSITDAKKLLKKIAKAAAKS